MKWVVPNTTNNSQPNYQQLSQQYSQQYNRQLDTNYIKKQVEVLSPFVELYHSQINITGFNPTVKQIYDFGFLSDDFPLSGKLFFTLNIILFVIISLKLFNIFKSNNVNKFISYSTILLNTILLFYPLYLIYWLNDTLNNIENFFKSTSSSILTNETVKISSIMNINYIVYIVIVLYLINLVIEILKSKDKLFKS
jgi:hypothetical protein